MTVRIDDHGQLRVITLDRPERSNAIDADMSARIGEALLAAEADDGVRALIITGAGERAFCSGMDLRAFHDRGESSAAEGPGLEVLTERFYPKPVVAAVNGAAVGGGLGIVLACDLVIAADHAMFGLPETRRGLVGVGATARAALRLPPAVAMELALTGEPIDAARAHVLGLVNRVTDRARLLSDAIEVAERIAANGPLAVAAAKRIVSEVARLQDGAPIAGMRPRFEHVRRSEDAREGAAAFLERRPPRFSGR